jgi:septal ring factor EnvC (AmiA/AmiB activator)
MADGAPSSRLVEARLKADIARLEATIASQELDKLEIEDKIERLDMNIEASRKEIERKKTSLQALYDQNPPA